uniref:Putative homing endonuclease n=1 Tax=Escherichia phage UFV-AREG1 TaxID=1837867 RepID=A0A173GAZ5_9CAUD
MDYEKIYNSLIDRARNRALTGYKERHHIIPKCLGGSNDASNLVDLTPEEHYVAHQLLVKIHPNSLKLSYAAIKMSVYSKDNIERKNTNKRHGWLRRKLAISVSENNKGKPAWNKGIPVTDEHREKLQTTWVFTFPDGHEEIHKGLREFCELHSLNASAMSAVCKGKRSQHKGFKCRKLDNISENDNQEYVSKPHPKGLKPHNLIAVKINGIEYQSIHRASKALGISRKKVEELNEY